MNITIITPLLPFPLDSGGTQAQFNMIDVLRKQHNFTIIYPESKHNSAYALSCIKKKWPDVNFAPYPYTSQYRNITFLISKAKRMFNLIFRKNSPSFQLERILKPYGYDTSKRFMAYVIRIIEKQKTDIVQIEFYPYLHLIDLLPDYIKTVFVHHELRYIRNERMTQPYKLSATQQAYMESLKSDEILTLNKYDKVITLTETDKQQLSTDGVTAPIAVSPAAISTDVTPLVPWNGCFAFLGGSGHAPNQEGLGWLTESVFPLIKWSSFTASSRFLLVGKGWGMNDVSNIAKEKVDILGFVPDLKTAIQGSILLVPILSGSGMRMKILEGAALGLPIITTSVGMEGLLFENKKSCLIADTPEVFAECITRLANDDCLRTRLAKNAQQVFIENYSKEALADKRNKIYESL